jgi:phytoene dehydrogenase-like protein
VTGEDFDVAVLGAGLGGLAAALHLARAGARVVVIERRSRVGGRCTTIRADGDLLPAGTVVIPCGDYLEELFAEFGVPFDVTALGTRGLYGFAGGTVEVPERGALRVLAQRACGDEAGAAAFVEAVRRVLAGHEPAGDGTLRDWLGRHTACEPLLGAFQALAGAYLATNSYEVSSSAFFDYLRGAAGAARIGIPNRGWGALVEPLAERIHDLGGTVRLGARASALRVEHGRATHVVVDDDRRRLDVAVRSVVSDVGPAATLALAPAAAWGPAFVRAVEAVPSSPGVALFFRHREPFLPGGGPLLPASARRACFVITPTAVAPGLAGDGHWTEVLVTFEDSRVQTRAAAAAATATAVSDVRALVGELAGQEPFKTITYRGAWPIYRAWPGEDLAPATPLANVFLAGDAVKPAHLNGTSAAAYSGRVAAGAALGVLG